MPLEVFSPDRCYSEHRREILEGPWNTAAVEPRPAMSEAAT